MRKFIFLALLITGVVAALGSMWIRQQLTQPLAYKGTQEFVLPAGQGPIRTIKAFAAKGWLPMPTWVARVWLKLKGGDLAIQAGTYAFAPGATLDEVFRQLQQGEVMHFEISLIEGLTFKQWLQSLRSHPRLVAGIAPEVIARIAADWQPYATTTITHLEGLLLADTYHFIDGTPASEILERASQAMQNYLLAAWRTRDPDLPYQTPVELLTMASIIEKETGLAIERPHIAGVFVNRLRRNMPLQTDPTVIYGIGEAFDGNLTRKHLREDTVYNTYVHKGLPPGPIAMVGREAIVAALNPLSTEDLYFVAKGDGSHQFSQTLQQHNRAVRKYQLKQQD